MKIHKELTLGTFKKWDLIRYIIKLEKTIKQARDKIITYDEVLNEKFEKEMLKILERENIL